MGQSSSKSDNSNPVSPSLFLSVPQNFQTETDQEGVQEGEDLSLYIPDECLALIFSRLEPGSRITCSLVCKRWFSVEAQSRKILSLNASADLGPHLPKIFSRFEHITRLGLRCDKKLPSIDDAALVLIGQHCTSLQKIKLKGCRQVSNEGLEMFAAHCTSLKRISCASCGFGARGLDALLQKCQDLEELSIKRLRHLEHNEFFGTRLGGGKIKRLCLKEVNNGHLFAPLIVGSKGLQTLILFKVQGDWDQLFEIIMEHMQSLVELRLERLRLGDRGLHAVAQCKNLQVLFLSKVPDCSNHGLASIANGCRYLRRLQLDGCFSGKIGDKGLVSIAEKCSELKELVLIGLSATTESLSVLGSNCKGLERLALWSSETFGDDELFCIASKFLALKKLCIKCCPISDNGLEAILAGCPNLSKVKIRKCRGVTMHTESAMQLSKSNKELVISLDNDLKIPVEEVDVNGEDPVADPPIPPRPSRSPLAKARLALLSAFVRAFP